MPDFQVSPLSIVNQIKGNLRDRYSAGYPILKELLQNADDACACRFSINALSGWPKATNPLLRGAGLLVVNDGNFREEDRRDIVSFGESSKASDSAAIGKFGIGQKAVFHLCDAFVVYAHGYPEPFRIVVNPFLNVEVAGNITQDWESLSDADLQLLRDEVSADFSDRCLVLWLPFRREGLQPALGTGFSTDFPSPSMTVEELAKLDDLRTLLTALRHLQSIEIRVHGQERCVLDVHAATGRLLGPRKDHLGKRSFRGKIETHPDKTVAPFVGLEATVQGDRLQDLQRSPHWPTTTTVLEPEPRPEKGEPHGAVTLSRGAKNSLSQLRMSWAVFLPVSDDSDIVVPIHGADLGYFHLLLHGYFFLDSGRLRIEGLDERVTDKEPSDAVGLRRAWNAELRDSVVLPLVPAVLLDALDSAMVTQTELAGLVTAVAESAWFQCNHNAICKEHALARVFEAPHSIAWRLMPSGSALRPLPRSVANAPRRIGELFADIHSWAQTRNIILCVDKSAALTKDSIRWMANDLDSLFSSLSSRAFQSRALASLLADYLDSVEQDESCRQASGPHLVSALRNAVSEAAPLAPSESVSRILAHVPSALLFPLPPSVEHRRVFRDLAAARTEVLPVRSTWVRDTSTRPPLSDNDLKALLDTLQPHLASEHADQAATAALAFLMRSERRISELAARPEYAAINVLRARDVRAGGVVSLSLATLFERARNGLLFGPSPSANVMLPLMVEALPGASPMIVEGKTAEFLNHADNSTLTLQSAGKGPVLALINKATDFGTVAVRSKLLRQLQPADRDDCKALRRLCAGAPEAGDASASIWFLEGMPEGLERVATNILRSSECDFVVPSGIAVELTPRLRAYIGMKVFDTERLEALLEENLDAIAHLKPTESQRDAFLLTSLSDSLLKRLPIHARSDGSIGNLENVFLEADWPIPDSLRDHVLTVRPCDNPKAREKHQSLVPAWAPESQILTTLLLPDPHEFRNDILDALAKLSANPLKLNPQLAASLCETPWLTAQDMTAAPEDVLALPEMVDEHARALLPRNAGRPPFWPMRHLTIDVRNHPGFEYLRRCVLPDELSSLEALALMIEDAQIVGRLGSAAGYPIVAFTALAMANADLKLPGWPLLAAVLSSSRDCPEKAKGIVEAFSEVRDGDTDLAAQHLDSLAGITAESGTNSPAASEAFLRGFEIVAKWSEGSRRKVFAGTRVPTKAGMWRSGREVIKNGEGIAPAHVLVHEFASRLRMGDSPSELSCAFGDDSNGLAKDPATHGEIEDIDLSDLEEKSASQQRMFLQAWRGRVPSDLVIVYLGIVGRYPALREVANEWEADATTDVDTLWCDLDDRLTPTILGIPLPSEIDRRRYIIKRIEGSRVRAIALSGEAFDAPLGDGESRLVVGNLHRNSQGIRSSDGKIRSLIVLPIRYFDPTTLSYGAAASVLRGLAETVATDCQHFLMSSQQQALKEILDKSVNVDQATLGDTVCLLRDRLPTILAELKLPTECRAQQALRDYQQKEGRVARLSGSAQLMASLKTELWQAISGRDVSRELLLSVRTKIREFGYSPNRVLFELFQNADDAYRQLNPVPEDACFRVTTIPNGSAGFRAAHWGRPINHLGSDPDEGRRLGQDRDLLNMLLMNFSEKRPEDDVTGKFGLGFKSVHMLSDSVGIASGFISLRTLGGFVPKEWSTGVDETEGFRRDDGSRATVIDVPFSVETAADGGAAIRAFRASMTWMPAFARSIRRIEIADGDTVAIDCKDAPLLGESTIRIITVSDSERRRALRFDLSGGFSLLVAIGPAGPLAFSSDLRRLWNVAPLEEDLRSAWLLNGPFPVDPGRGRLAGSVEDHRTIFRELGTTLGERLLTLHNAVASDWQRLASALDLDASEDRARPLFWDCFFGVINRDFDDDRARFLHTGGRGYARLVGSCPVVPTGLSQPFDGHVRASEVERFTDGALSETVVLEKVRDWPSLTGLQGRMVTSEVAGQLSKIGFGKIRAKSLTDILCHEMGNEPRIDAELATRLGKVVTLGSIENKPLDQERRAILDAAKKASFHCQDGTWRTVRDLNSEFSDSEDEKSLCRFAPEGALLDRRYQGAALEFFKVARAQSGYGPQPRLLHDWATNANDDNRRRAVLRYIISGRQGRALADAMRNDPPVWLPQPIESFLTDPLLSGWSDEDKKRLFLELGAHDLFRVDEPGSVSGRPDADPWVVLDAIHGWWTANHDTQRDAYAKGIYPEFYSPSQLRSADDQAGWFTMFALACFQSLGRTQDEQHRAFIERGQREGWWQELAVSRPPDDAQPWLERLESWSAPEQHDQEFFPWRRALVDLYTFSRGLDEYVEIISKLPHLVQDQGSISLNSILRPSYAPALRQLGLDAAPINRSLGIGVNWMIRELLRHGVYETDDVHLIAPYSWAPTGRVRELLNTLGADIGVEADMDVSPAIYDFVVSHLASDHALFAGDFDLPLQLITRSENRAALEQCFAQADRDAPVFGYTFGGDAGDEIPTEIDRK